MWAVFFYPFNTIFRILNKRSGISNLENYQNEKQNENE